VRAVTEAVRGPVHTQVSGTTLLVTLDNPKANAVNVAVSNALYEAFARLESDPTLRAGVLTGAGERFFSAGWDLKAAAAGEAVDADHGPGGFAGITEWFTRTKPIIAAVNGIAFGGGFELALAADLVVAAEHAQFALPEVGLGIVPDAGGLLRLPRRMPRALALELILTRRRMTADEAARWGVVNEVVAADRLVARALELAEVIAEGAPLSVAAALEVVRATEAHDVEGAYARMRSTGDPLPAYQAMLRSEDSLEGPRAFAEGRDPVWQGR
jgi:crotonobetainyl-CoA hydratase